MPDRYVLKISTSAVMLPENDWKAFCSVVCASVNEFCIVVTNSLMIRANVFDATSPENNDKGWDFDQTCQVSDARSRYLTNCNEWSSNQLSCNNC